MSQKPERSKSRVIASKSKYFLIVVSRNSGNSYKQLGNVCANGPRILWNHIPCTVTPCSLVPSKPGEETIQEQLIRFWESRSLLTEKTSLRELSRVPTSRPTPPNTLTETLFSDAGNPLWLNHERSNYFHSQFTQLGGRIENKDNFEK